MKIIYIATSVIPAQKANSYQVMKMCEAFAREGHDVELLIPVRFGRVREKSEPFEYYGVDKCFKIRKIFSIDLIPLEKIIGHLGFWMQNASFSLLTLIYVLFANPDIIYSRDRFTLLFLGLFKKNLVYEVHGLPAKFRLYEKCLYGRVKKIIVITNQIKKILVDKRIAGNEKILVAPDAVDLEKFDKIKMTKKELREELGLPKDKKLIAYIGKLRTKAKEKGVADIIRAFKKLAALDANMVFVGGEAESVEQYKALMSDLGLKKEDVVFIGHVPFPEVPKYEKAMDVLVMPFPWTRHYAYHMSPLKMFEYMASGVPIVTTDLPTVREVLDEASAIFVRPGEPKDLARGIDRVLEDKEFSRQIAERSQKLAKNYTWQRRVKDILGFIDNNADGSLEADEETVKKINEIYHDKEAKFYDRLHQGIMEREEGHWEQQRKYFVRKEKLAVLDVGTGTGLVPYLVVRWLKKGDELICNDISSVMLKQVKEKLNRLDIKCTLKFLKAPADQLGLPTESIDVITLNSVLHHLPSARAFFREASRVLKPGGVMIIFHEPNKKYSHSKFLLFLNRLFNKLHLLFVRRKKGENYEELYNEVRKELVRQQVLTRRLSDREITQLVDYQSPTAGGGIDQKKGFDVSEIFKKIKKDYKIELFFTYSHLGKRNYSRTIFIKAIEWMLGKLMPKKGGAFCSILRRR